MMENARAFDLMSYLAGRFPNFVFGGDVLEQSALGLRFNIGLEHVGRAVAIYEQAFGNADRIILISEDWYWTADPARWYSLFALPGVIRLPSLPLLTSCQSRQPSEDDVSTITWADLPSAALSAEQLFQSIANKDHGRTPSVKGRVYILDPRTGMLLHMYDDRGLDIIAAEYEILVPLYKRFGGWINRAHLGPCHGDGE